MLPECERAGLAFLPYFPLASGVLTGKYQRGQPPPAGTRLSGVQPNAARAALADTVLAVVERLTEFAEQRGPHHAGARHRLDRWRTAAVASVIAGATSAEQVHANVAAADWASTDADMAEIDATRAPRRPDHSAAAQGRVGHLDLAGGARAVDGSRAWSRSV